MSEIDHAYTDRIVCPWCGYTTADEDWCYSDQETHDVECDMCEKPFSVHAVVSYTYVTRRPACDDEHDFEFTGTTIQKRDAQWSPGKITWVDLPPEKHHALHSYKCRRCEGLAFRQGPIGEAAPPPESIGKVLVA